MSSKVGDRSFGLPADARIRKRRDYLAVQGGGVRQFTKHFMVFFADGAGTQTRIGVTASKKVGNAVRRNRWKRVVRDAFRHLRPQLADRPVTDVVVIARKGVDPPSSEVARGELRAALKRWQKRNGRR